MLLYILVCLIVGISLSGAAPTLGVADISRHLDYIEMSAEAVKAETNFTSKIDEGAVRESLRQMWYKTQDLMYSGAIKDPQYGQLRRIRDLLAESIDLLNQKNMNDGLKNKMDSVINLVKLIQKHFITGSQSLTDKPTTSPSKSNSSPSPLVTPSPPPTPSQKPSNPTTRKPKGKFSVCNPLNKLLKWFVKLFYD